MQEQTSQSPSSPFWKPSDVRPREHPEYISDAEYFREFVKGIAEQLTHDDWLRIYGALKKGVQAFMDHKGMEINGLYQAFELGLWVGKAMHDEWLKK